jgi:hypothetical protein
MLLCFDNTLSRLWQPNRPNQSMATIEMTR